MKVQHYFELAFANDHGF